MRHAKHKKRLGRSGSYRSCMIANVLKDLIDKERIVTSLAKAKELKKYADKMITLAKNDSLANRRRAISKMKLQYNRLTPKDARKAKGGDQSAYNTDRKVIGKLFGELKDRYATRQGGYTRIIRKDYRLGDSCPTCILEYIS